MDSKLLASIHLVSVILFLLTYLVKTILIFTNVSALEKYSRATRVPEMIISTLFLATGIWLYIILGGIKVFHIIKLVLVFASIPLAIIAFKKLKKGLALLSLLLIIGAYGLAEVSKNKPFIPANVVVSNDNGSPIALGAKVYHANCAFCHGTDGNKMYRGAIDLSQDTLSGEGVRLMVKLGSKGKMPAYQNILSEQDISELIVYVESLKHRPEAGTH